MKKFILNLIFIIPFLSFSFSDKDLIHYFNQHPDAKIKCYLGYNVYFLEEFSCEISYRNKAYYIYFTSHDLGHTQYQIVFINIGTSDKPNFEIVYQDRFYEKYSNTYKKLFDKDSRVLFYDPNTEKIYFFIRYTKGINQYLDNHYHSTLYFYKDDIIPKSSSDYLNKVFTSKSSEFYKILDSENFSPKIPTLTLDKIKSIYKMALKEQHCFKSLFGCRYKTMTLFDTIAMQNPDISKTLVMITDKIFHDIKDYKPHTYIISNNPKVISYFFNFDKYWNFHQVLIYRASDDEKIYVLDPYFLEDGVIEYDQWRLEYLKAQNDFTVELYQYLD